MSRLEGAAFVSARLALKTTQGRLQWWLRNHNGILPAYPVMPSPPTVTVGTGTSFNGRSSGNELFRWDNANLTHIGSTVISDGAAPTRAVGSHITYADNSKGGGTAPIRTRFTVFGEKFGAMFRGTSQAYVNAIIDGKYVVKGRATNPIFPVDGNPHEVLFDFGTNAKSFYPVAVAVSAGGTGYTVGDVLTAVGGTGTATTFQVTAVSSGVVSSVAVKTPGAYSVSPTSPVSTTGGTGTGATVQVQAYGAANSAAKSHTVELIWHGDGQKLYGINTPTLGALRPFPTPIRQPKLVILGDSQQATYLDYGGAQMGLEIAQRLAMADKYVGSHVGGTGWETNNTSVTPNGLKWSDSRRVADVIAMAPDLLVIIGSQNDTVTGTLSAAVTATLNLFLASNSALIIVGIGPVAKGTQALSDALKAGYLAASDQTRVRYIDNVAEGWISGTGTVAGGSLDGNASLLLSSDNAHLPDEGQRHFVNFAAPAIGQALVEMIG